MACAGAGPGRLAARPGAAIVRRLSLCRRRIGTADRQAIFADHVGAQGLLEGGGFDIGNLEIALLVPNPDRADIVAGQTTDLAQHRQKATRVLMRAAPALNGEPHRGAEFRTRVRRML